MNSCSLWSIRIQTSNAVLQMTSFLFWNLNKKPLQRRVANIALQYDVHVVILIETSAAIATTLRNLNRHGPPSYHYSPGLCKKVEVYSRFTGRLIRPILETNRLTIRHLQLPGLIDMLVAATHFPSKANMSAPSQQFEAVSLAGSILSAEKTVGHSRTILVGDLNMNPFEAGVVGGMGLNAVMTRQLANRGSRVIQGKRYPYFYNPMWALFGDANPGPPGTYYYLTSDHMAYYWNMFDQVLVRPDLMNRFNTSRLEILDTDGDVPLVDDRGIPNTSIGSDHLPIIFEIDL